MEVKILHKFHDREDFTKVYPVGETVIFDDLRAEQLISLGLVEKVAEEAVEEVAEVEETPVVETEETPVEEATEAPEEEEEAVEAETPVAEMPIKPVATSRRSSKNN